MVVSEHKFIFREQTTMIQDLEIQRLLLHAPRHRQRDRLKYIVLDNVY